MQCLLHLLCGILLACAPAPAGILLNEINVAPPGLPDVYEYVELRSTSGGMEFTTLDATGTGEPLTLILLGMSGRIDGQVTQALRLA